MPLTLCNPDTFSHLCRPSVHKVPVSRLHLLWQIGAHCRSRHDPLYATFLLLGVIGTFKPYPTLSDPGLFLSLISLFPEIYPCACAYHPSSTSLMLNGHMGGRSSLCNRNGASAPTRLSASPAFPPFVDWNWHRERKFLLCEHACVWHRQRFRTLGLCLGGSPCRVG